MTGKTSFGAPWSPRLKRSTLLAATLIAVVGFLQVATFPRHLLGGKPFVLSMCVLSGVLVGTALFLVRGYDLTTSELLVQRLLWATRIPLADLKAAWADPAAMDSAIRLFGNGGLFAWTGVFSNRRTGRFRAFATEPRNAVVLRFAARLVVVTPDEPQELLDSVALLCPGVEIGKAPPDPPRQRPAAG
jgi:hypothetical protein